MRVLIVDDDEDVRSMLRIILEASRHQVTEAADGQEGYERLQEGSTDLMLLDDEMPRLDGVGLLQLCGQDLPPTIAVVCNYWVCRTAMLEGGVQAIVRKPFEIDDLLAAVARVGQSACRT